MENIKVKIENSGRKQGVLSSKMERVERHPWGMSYVWQTQDLKSEHFGCVARKGVTVCFSDVLQIKDLLLWRRCVTSGETPTPECFVERVRNRLILKDLTFSSVQNGAH